MNQIQAILNEGLAHDGSTFHRIGIIEQFELEGTFKDHPVSTPVSMFAVSLRGIITRGQGDIQVKEEDNMPLYIKKPLYFFFLDCISYSLFFHNNSKYLCHCVMTAFHQLVQGRNTQEKGKGKFISCKFSVKVLQNLLFPFFSFFMRHLYLTRCLSSLFIHLYSHILLGLTNILQKLMFNYCYFFLQLPTFLKLGGGEEEEGES